jgi:carboxylesterase
MGIEWGWLRDTGVRHAHIQEIELRGTAPCSVLLFHGLTGGPIELGYVAHHLHHRAKLSVSCPALIHHGQPLAVLARTRWEELWESACSHFRHAHAQAQQDRVPLFVGGLSMGAVLSLMLAAEFKDEVAGVACLSPTLFYDGWDVPWFHRFLPLVDYTPLKYFSYMRVGPPYGLKDEVLREKMHRQYETTALSECDKPLPTYAHFPIRLLCEYRHLIAQAVKMLPLVTAPVLAIQAVEDDSTSPANASYVLEHVSSQKKELLLLENSYHIITADLEREKVAEAMARFFLANSPERASPPPTTPDD